MGDALEKCYVCKKCCKYLHREWKPTKDEEMTSTGSPDANEPLCLVCMGLWQSAGKQKIRAALEKACEPYGGISQNQFAHLPNHVPTASFAGDILIRYKWFATAASTSGNAAPVTVYIQDLKQHIYGQIKSILEEAAKIGGAEEDLTQDSHVRKEEQGTLQLHVLCVPPKTMPSMIDHVGASNNNKKRKRGRQKSYTTQGGDPRMNLESRLQSQGYEWMAQSAAESAPLPKGDNATKFQQYLADSAQPLEYHFAVFRRPIFLYGFYTKSRRDVSQTPFIVQNEKADSGKKETERKGVTSVEEQICGPIEKVLSVSTLNNLPPRQSKQKQKETKNISNTGEYTRQPNDDNQDSVNKPNDNPSTAGGTIYGMIKFHASGREDMDVRMLVRADSETCRGRPFCVQIVDALRPLTKADQLQELINTINYTAEQSGSDGNPQHSAESQPDNTLTYGRNPLGVGISPDEFKVVSSKVFSSLQQDTESKVKHYGCHCWSKNELPQPTANNDDNNDITSLLFMNIQFPLTIHQKTPIRVLHRRANLTRERQILDAKATRIDDHHFRLELSTSAGTYVKEFVYGDLGRSKPSVSSLLGCKTNLLQLDCEGIEMPEAESSKK